MGGASDGRQFSVPHSIALIEDLNLICVADRENERIQCFSADITDDERALPTGILITKAENVGRIYAIREKSKFNFFFLSFLYLAVVVFQNKIEKLRKTKEFLEGILEIFKSIGNCDDRCSSCHLC